MKVMLSLSLSLMKHLYDEYTPIFKRQLIPIDIEQQTVK